MELYAKIWKVSLIIQLQIEDLKTNQKRLLFLQTIATDVV